jgi:hypothetical protein
MNIYSAGLVLAEPVGFGLTEDFHQTCWRA